jgi:hypothetical protein
MITCKKEQELAKGLIDLIKMMEKKAENVSDAFGGECDLTTMFDDEVDAILELMIDTLNLYEGDGMWATDLILNVARRETPIETFYSFAAKDKAEAELYAYNTRDGYYIISENPRHNDFVNFFGHFSGGPTQ